MAYRYYHGLPREASGRFFREAAVSVMGLRHLMNHVVNGQSRFGSACCCCCCYCCCCCCSCCWRCCCRCRAWSAAAFP
ncbi:hypothetical protein PUN28_019904 [Cardiocondyla obscurior]|uniref:Cysteine-rich transmembrane CYSTM domain-containing protein n=1 Tax=Cardiocondyla obscurior TaxID=286306 RepID=A0AAW2E9A5_9HYME